MRRVLRESYLSRTRADPWTGQGKGKGEAGAEAGGYRGGAEAGALWAGRGRVRGMVGLGSRPQGSAVVDQLRA